ncbi:MAG: B12-binding domain-containing radical SAM protein [Candidatus Niyogibacteria bacterium]|nr:MAG: B12-binding domain-containing radical SAM protein [Candidatus Niyogibacteria bacterium]
MRGPKVLLVYPPNQLMAVEIPRPDGSLGPLYLAGALEGAGVETDILDASVGPEEDDLRDTFYRMVELPSGLVRIGMTYERLREFIADGEYDIVGINSNFTPQTRMALEVARAAKSADKDILVIVGGVNARSLVSRFIKSDDVDVICLTEGERIIVNLVEAHRHGRDFGEISGVLYKRNGRVVSNPVCAANDIHTNLDRLPFPLWHKLPFGHYDRIASPHGSMLFKDQRYAPIMTSRGCPFRCSYCHISKEKEDHEGSGGIGEFRVKSVERVMAELEILKGLGVRKIYIEDDSLLAKKPRVKEIFARIRSMEFKIADVNGVNLVHFQKRGSGGKLEIDMEYLELLKEGGFDQIVFPVESGSQRVLDKYATAKLNLETLDVIELVRVASGVGIVCPINMMIGFPDETEKEIMQSIELAKRLVEAGAYYCTFFIPIPFPGSALYDTAIRDGYLEPNFDTDIMNWKNPVMKNTVVPPERLTELRDWAWREVNTAEYVSTRLKAEIGSRWNSEDN